MIAPYTKQIGAGSNREMRVQYSIVLVRYVIAFALAWLLTMYFLDAPRLTAAAAVATFGILAGIILHYVEWHLTAAVVWLSAVNIAVALGCFLTPPEGNVSILFVATATAPFAMFSARTHRPVIILMVGMPIVLWVVDWASNSGPTQEFEISPEVAANVLAPASVLTVFGTILFVVGYFVRQTRQHSKWLMEAQQKALKSSEAKSALMRSVSHEMLTPLHAISGYAELLNSDAKAGSTLSREQIERQSDEILTASRTLRQIIENIFDFANWQGEQASPETSQISVYEVLQSASAQFLDALSQKKLTFKNQVDPDLSVDANPVWTASIFKQLLDNAVKFSNRDGTIEVFGRAVENGMVEIVFKDDGPGFPDGVAKHAFEAFERLGQETGTISGVGIGLPLAQKFALAMGGQITVDDGLARGAQVRLFLPQAFGT